jgi:hypothetical protein
VTHRWHHCCVTLADVRARCRIDQSSHCWHWLGAMTANGTPRMYALDLDRCDKRVMPAHRAVWMIAHGESPGARLVYRACCRNTCVNPAHLRLAYTRAEIGAHWRRSGALRGVATEQRRANIAIAQAAQGIVLTAPEVVRAIRAAPAHVTGLELAALHGIASQTVSRIRRGESHRQVLP